MMLPSRIRGEKEKADFPKPGDGAPDIQSQISELRSEIEALKQSPPSAKMNLSDVLLDMRRPIDKARGIFTVTSATPSAAPQDAFDQIRVYVNGATLRLYWYDWNATTWHYVTATA